MITFVFTKVGEKAFLKLSRQEQERIASKLRALKYHADILSVLKRLYDFAPATHRLRIGNYRLILELRNRQKDDFEFWVLDVGHRKDIYRGSH